MASQVDRDDRATTPGRWFACAVAVVALAGATFGCSSGSEDSSDSSNGSEPAASDEAAVGTTVAEGPCPAETEIALLNAEDLTGSLEIVTEFADVTLDETADLVFATYEIPEDPQFGISAPVGDPEAPTGGTIVQFTLTAGDSDTFPTGTFPEDATESPRIAAAAAYHGSDRISPLGDHTIEVTEVTDEHICGTITGIGKTDLQSFPYVEGTFIVPIV